MFPGHAGMNSYPYQRNQTPFTQYYQPKEDATAPSFMYEPWPNNYGYPLPTQCHSCCNHPQYPAYHNFRPPFPQFPPPPAHSHCYGGYPAYPQPYPFSYAPPYTMELPRYEYDKSVVPHCCGCPNHQCNAKEGNNVKIEEHEPDVEPKKSESLVPAGENKLPYPLLIPPQYTMNKEEHHDSPRVKKPQQEVRTIEQDPKFRQGWFPLDIESIRKLMEGGDGRKNSNQENKVEQGKKVTDGENKDHNKQFPYPIFWMPYEGQVKDRLSGQEERNGESIEKAPAATFKVVPKNSEHTDNEAEKLKTAEGVGNLAPERATKIRTIPVKQLEESVPKSSKKDEEHKRGATTEKNVEGKNGANGNSSSPTKKSKLPPICLRVDPPKRRNGNGSSRSPSPPGDKKRQEATSGTKTELKAGEEKQGSKTVEVKVADVDRKVMQEADGGKSDDAKSAEDKGLHAQEVQGAEESKPQEASKQERKMLSETEAATRIEAAYRGYEVRRWEPLNKLRQIAKVQEEATEVKKHIEAYDSHAGSCMEEREKTAVGETIMNLLLKLDTIQGLLPSMRDVRKSVAKDLIMLQERLDSIPSQKFNPIVQETANTETESETLNAPSSVEGSKDTTETVKEPSTVSTKDKSSQVSQSVPKAAEEDELNESTQPPASQDGGCGSQNEETLETFLENTSGNEVAIQSVGSSEGLKAVDSSTAGKETKSCETKETLETSLGNKSEDEAAIPSAGSSDGSETFSGKPPTESQQPLASGADMDNEKPNMLNELPREVVEDEEKEVSKEDEDVSSTVLTEKPVEGAGQAVEVDSVHADEDKELHVLTEISQDTNEEDTKEPNSEVASLETLNNNENLEVSCEKDNLKGEELLTAEPESLKPDDLSSGPQETLNNKQETEPPTENPVLESEDLPSVEPVSCNPDSAVDIDVPVSEVSANENDTKQSPQMSNAELDSATSCLENPARNDEHVQEEKESPQDQETVLGSEFVGSETAGHEELFDMSKASKPEAQIHKDYGASDKLDEKIIEENEKLRMMLENLITSGKEQQDLISSLSGKVKDLEKKLTKDKKKKKPSKRPRVIVSHSSSKNWKAL